MTKAWMKCESERQEFMKRIWSRVIQEEEQTPKNVQARYDLCDAILAHFSKKDGVQKAPPYANNMESFFRTQILPAFTEFARTPEEADALLADLFIKQCESVAIPFKLILQTQELETPELVFEGHGTMDDVDLLTSAD
jgi:hypothetical protein